MKHWVGPAPANKTVDWRNEWGQVTEEEKIPCGSCRKTSSMKVLPGPLHLEPKSARYCLERLTYPSSPVLPSSPKESPYGADSRGACAPLTRCGPTCP